MKRIYGYTVSCDAKTLLKNGGWFEEDYLSLFDFYNAEILSDEEKDWERYYSGSEFEFSYDFYDEPTVYVTFYILYDVNKVEKEMTSCGCITQDDILWEFPELGEKKDE